jgi:hypothetical protein
MRTRPDLFRSTYGCLLALLAAGCTGGDLTLPGSGGASGLSAVSGDRQEGEIGAVLPEPLVVRATDATGRPVQGAVILFRFNGDVGGEISPASAVTDAEGRAAVEVRLGTTTGDQIVEAEVLEAADLAVSFRLTAFDEVDDGDDKGNHGKGGRGEGHDDDDDDDDAD